MHMLNNEYRLLRRLGRGGMGEVWEAARIKENHVVVPCAIKLLHLDFTETTRERQLFFDEARIATQLDHSRIVKVIDIGTDKGGRPFLVMERVDGIDLRSFLKEAEKEELLPLDIEITTFIIGEVLAALDYAHERTVGGADAGIIHSDVTPGNIMISSSGEVKLTDFGIARFAATAGPMTRAIGTPRYMSPEQLVGDPKRETDIYGLGVVLHEMLDGNRFLDGCTPDQFRSRVLEGPPPELTRTDVPKWLDDLRRRMVATDHRDRPRASEARAVLIEHCPRYLAAGERLKTNYYARLIGRRRSGVTQLLSGVDEAHLHGLSVQIGQDAADSKIAKRPQLDGIPEHDPHREVTERDPPAGPIAPLAAPEAHATHTGEHHEPCERIVATEVLPAHSSCAHPERVAKHELSETGEDSVSTPLLRSQASPIIDHGWAAVTYSMWLAIIGGAAALILLTAVIVLLAQLLAADTPPTPARAPNPAPAQDGPSVDVVEPPPGDTAAADQPPTPPPANAMTRSATCHVARR
ncbi:serine/threonine protein kinase [Enhygromyxa salina]|uniref:Serine/threonine protein kinase n=1 Tax=Enhygromyxa salina TaxID=215803 RepID=A0A0C2CVC9_9BACT|nr:serine/threonine-protein kinase [Enhygromyxa salina]KIG15061.1 serine/threonine protein kinase [Enhygromyxa salina]